jgi:hypothetical protein
MVFARQKACKGSYEGLDGMRRPKALRSKGKSNAFSRNGNQRKRNGKSIQRKKPVQLSTGFAIKQSSSSRTNPVLRARKKRD